MDPQRGVLLHEPVEALHHLLVVGLALGLEGEGDGGGRIGERREDDRALLVGERVARGGFLELRHRDDVARHRGVDLLLLLPLQLERVADALAPVARGVDAVEIGVDAAGDDAQHGQLAGERIDDRLEDVGRERRRRVRGALDLLAGL